MDQERRDARAGILTAFGASGPVVDELLAFGDGAHPPGGQGALPRLPLPAEPHVEVWQGYAAEAEGPGAWDVLRRRLPQLQFSVRAGISQTEAYRAATRRGEVADTQAGALALRSPGDLHVWICHSPAGPIPVLCTAERDDFVLLVRALSCRNEPEPVPESMGACLVTGYNNWDRLRRYQAQWLAGRSGPDVAQAWAAEFRRIIPLRELYQDRFLILTEGPYSGVPAQEMGVAPEEWLRLSRTIRLAHECTHYLTLRLFASVRDHPLDELISDYVGIAAACGGYRADWFLRFVGLEGFPDYREGGRLENYRGRPPLSDAAFRVLQRLVRAAATNLERFDRHHFTGSRASGDRALAVPGLYQTTLEELASSDAEALLE
jgi:hypothetical protein